MTSEPAPPTCSNSSRKCSGTTVAVPGLDGSARCCPPDPAAATRPRLRSPGRPQPPDPAQPDTERDHPRLRRAAGADAVQPRDHLPDQGHDRLPATQRVRDAAGDADRHPRPQPGRRHPARPGAHDATRPECPRGDPPVGHPRHLARHGLPPTAARRLPTHRHRHRHRPADKDPRSQGPSAPSYSCSPAAVPHSNSSPAKEPTLCAPLSPDPRRHTAPRRTEASPGPTEPGSAELTCSWCEEDGAWPLTAWSSAPSGKRAGRVAAIPAGGSMASHALARESSSSGRVGPVAFGSSAASRGRSAC